MAQSKPRKEPRYRSQPATAKALSFFSWAPASYKSEGANIQGRRHRTESTCEFTSCRFQIKGREALNPWLPSVIPSEVEESLIIHPGRMQRNNPRCFASLNMTFTLPAATRHPFAANSRDPPSVFQLPL